MGFNRDEQWSRAASHDPVFETHHSVPGACARDAAANGTWLFTNVYGLTLSILNAYPKGLQPAPGKISRGRIPLLAASEESWEKIETALLETTWQDFAPCEILLLAPGEIGHYGWDGRNFTKHPSPKENFLTSSSVRTKDIRKARKTRFRQISHLSVDSILDDISVADPPASILVTRQDGGSPRSNFQRA
jgi:hypothetical protein